jgi:ABC-type branched-subunit amino acid transport system substrate-binding protein
MSRKYATRNVTPAKAEAYSIIRIFSDACVGADLRRHDVSRVSAQRNTVVDAQVTNNWRVMKSWKLPVVTACAFVAFSWAAHAEIVIGVAVPSTGPKVAYGATIVAAAKHEVDRINAAGGIGGRNLDVAVADDGCSAEGGAAVATRFVEQKVDLVIGHPCSNAALAAARVYAQSDVIFVAIGARHPELTKKSAGPNIFRLGGSDDAQSVETAWFINREMGPIRLGIVHDRTAYARTLAEGVVTASKTYPGTSTNVHGIVAGEKDYAATVSVLVAAQVDAVYFAGFPTEGALILRQLRTLGSSARFFASDALDDPAFIQGAGSTALGTGLITTSLAQDGAEHVVKALKAYQGVIADADPLKKLEQFQLGLAEKTDGSFSYRLKIIAD